MSLHTTLKRSRLMLGALAGSLLLTGSAQALSENLSGSLALDYNSHFMSYGANVWNTDSIGDQTIVNPSVSLTYSINEGSGVYVGAWADVNDTKSTPTYYGKYVQELDVWVGYYFTAGDFKFDFTLQQWYYGQETEGIFDVTVSYATMFSPYIKAHNRFDTVGGAQQKGTMFEVGASLYSTTVGAVSLSFPVAVGFSLDDYHVAGEDGYAYSMVAAKFSVPLAEAIDFHGAVSYYNTDEDTTGNAHDGYFTLNLGVGYAF